MRDGDGVQGVASSADPLRCGFCIDFDDECGAETKVTCKFVRRLDGEERSQPRCSKHLFHTNDAWRFAGVVLSDERGPADG